MCQLIITLFRLKLRTLVWIVIIMLLGRTLLPMQYLGVGTSGEATTLKNVKESVITHNSPTDWQISKFPTARQAINTLIYVMLNNSGELDCHQVLTGQVGATFNITVYLQDVINLSAWQIHLLFDASVINMIDVSYGNIFEGKNVISTSPVIDNTVGSLLWGQILLNDAPMNGSGTLLNATLQVIGEGDSSLYLEHIDTYLLDPTIAKIPYKVKHGYYLYKSVSLNLKSGWNLITPLNTTYTASTLCAAIPLCTHINRWNASTQSFETYPGRDFPIEWHQGYFVYVTKDTIFSLNRSAFTPSIPFQEGWQAVGWWNFINASTTVKEVADILRSEWPEYDNLTVIIARWDTLLSRFITYPYCWSTLATLSVGKEGFFAYYSTRG